MPGHFDIVQMRHRSLDHRPALLDREHRGRFLAVRAGSYNNALEQAAGRFDDLKVPIMEGIERPWEQRCPHASPLSRKRANVTRVPP